MKAPSIKSLSVLGIDNNTAKLIRSVIKNEMKRKEIYERFPKVEAWRNTLYNEPSWHQIKMETLNFLLEGYGVESIGDFNCYPPKCKMEFINMGDTYTPTLVYHKGSYLVRSWGDMVQKYNY